MPLDPTRAVLNAGLVGIAYSATFMASPDSLDLSEQGMQRLATVRCTDEDGPDIYGFVAVNQQNKRVRVAYRGTDDILEGLEDLDAWPVDAPEFGKDAKAHEWFLRLGRSAMADEVPLVEFLKDYASYDLEVAGHSLGASLATQLYGMVDPFWKASKYLLAVASPRTFNSLGAITINRIVGTIELVLNPADVVTHAPTEDMGYAHVRGAIALKGADPLKLLDPLYNHSLTTYQQFIPSSYAL